jgi:hypothetical protein
LNAGWLFTGKQALDRYLMAVYFMGVAVATAGFLVGGVKFTTYLLLFSLYGAAAAPYLVDLGNNCRLSTCFPFVLASGVYLGPGAAAVTAVASSLSFSLARRNKMPPHKRMFNVCDHVIGGVTAAFVFIWLGGDPATIMSEATLRAILGATCAFYLVNTGLVSIASALEQGRPLLPIWIEKFQWTAYSFLAGGSLAIILILLVKQAGVYTCFLAFPFCVLIYHSWTMRVSATSFRGPDTAPTSLSDSRLAGSRRNSSLRAQR